MNGVEYRFLEPLDVLFMRGNKLFGDPGSFGESLIPPWPSVAAGAIRSRMLADDKVDLAEFASDASGAIDNPSLGSPQNPGSFAVTGFYLARRLAEAIEILVTPPADLVIGKTDAGTLAVRRLNPTEVAGGIASSAHLPLLPVLAEARRGKPVAGYWLKQAGWIKYLNGALPDAGDLIEAGKLWQIEPRVGVGLDADTRRASDGKLFSMQAVAMRPDSGFLVAIRGAEPPLDGLLRFGGDGRAAAVSPAAVELPQADYDALLESRRCRIVLTTPGLFPEGWRLPGAGASLQLCIGGVRARLVAAAVPRAEVVSGWDLAKGQPKPAQRVAPAGSVYWLDDLDATPDELRKLAENGLWNHPCEDASRRAEGFNRFNFAAY